MIYNFIDKVLMNDFENEIEKFFKANDKLIVFDVGCFQGKFSKKIKKKFKNSIFYLFDPNDNLIFNEFNFYPYALYNIEATKNYYFNSFLPSSGSGIDSVTYRDSFWNFTRRLATLGFKKKYKIKNIKTTTLDKFTIKNSINHIDILKIDVEGSELKVLQGGGEILYKTKLIQVEIISPKKEFKDKREVIIKFLKKYNFKLVKEKNILSTSVFSNIKAADLLFHNEAI